MTYVEKIADIIESGAEDLLNDDGADFPACVDLAKDILKEFALKEQPWPTKSGWYWFYGDPFCSEYHVERYQKGLQSENPWKPDIYSVRVRQTSNAPLYVVSGHFFENRLPGLWAEALVPDAPTS